MMSQDFLIGISTAMLVAFIAIISIYIYYFLVERRRYLFYWTIGWFFYIVRISFLIIATLFDDHFITSLIYDFSAIATPFFILLGTSLYFRQQQKIHMMWHTLS